MIEEEKQIKCPVFDKDVIISKEYVTIKYQGELVGGISTVCSGAPCENLTKNKCPIINK